MWKQFSVAVAVAAALAALALRRRRDRAASTTEEARPEAPRSEAVVCDSRIFYNIIPDDPETLFAALLYEVAFSEMRHKGGAVPRRVAVQTDRFIRDGVFAEPVYRHPVDFEPPVSPVSRTVERLRSRSAALLKTELNHCLVQHYRNGSDHISEHADKTLDVLRHSAIANLSVGAQRTLVLRRKKRVGDVGPRPAVRVALPHASLFVLGPETNRLYTHEIRRDNRMESQKSDAEKACGGERVSLTFRCVATFRDENGNLFGQGARRKALGGADASDADADSDAEVARLLRAFRRENRSPDFDWDASYGKGFDVVATSGGPP
ncbi:hypothetical protein M885DRAFT_530973 [Pelagophyceae sp. CCMP2097]|nr:hypothetical protein M885DRAFT_530973 [Pelagophyceae sp. CCMP2097]